MYLPNSIIFLYGRFASIDFIDKNKTGLHRGKNKKTESGNIQVPPPPLGYRPDYEIVCSDLSKVCSAITNKA